MLRIVGEVPFGAAVLKIFVGADGATPLSVERVFALKGIAFKTKMRVVPRSLKFRLRPFSLGRSFLIFDNS